MGEPGSFTIHVSTPNLLLVSKAFSALYTTQEALYVLRLWHAFHIHEEREVSIERMSNELSNIVLTRTITTVSPDLLLVWFSSTGVKPKLSKGGDKQATEPCVL